MPQRTPLWPTLPCLTGPRAPRCVALTLWKACGVSHVRFTCFWFCSNNPLTSNVSSGRAQAAAARGRAVGQRSACRPRASLGSEHGSGHGGAARGPLTSSPSMGLFSSRLCSDQAPRLSGGFQGSSPPAHTPISQGVGTRPFPLGWTHVDSSWRAGPGRRGGSAVPTRAGSRQGGRGVALM